MQLDWLDPEHLSDRDLAGAVAVLEAARQVDCPHQLGLTTSWLAADLRYGWDGEVARTAVVRNSGGRVTAVLGVSVSPWDNAHVAGIEVTVDPTARRQGLGTALFAAGVDQARAGGQTLVVAGCWDVPAARTFATAMGLEKASEEVKRSQDMLNLDWALLEQLAARAAEHSRDYVIESLPVPTPPDLLPAVAEMTGAINDAPIDDLDIDDEVFTPARIVAFEVAQAAHGLRLHRLVARLRTTGELAGHTIVGVDELRPWHANQLDTSVLRAHRGHRLGLQLKVAMLWLLRDAEPQLRRLDTWNAASNTHMIGVNEALGYHVVAGAIEWQRHL